MIPRPRQRDKAVLEYAAHQVAERVCEEWDIDGDVGDWTRSIAKEIGFHDCGYALARELERWHGIHPDTALVELLDEAGCAVRDAHKDALTKWVKMTGWTPKFSVGDRVECRHGVGRVNEINVETSLYLFAPDADAGKYRLGGGIHVWEDELTACDSGSAPKGEDAPAAECAAAQNGAESASPEPSEVHP